MDVKVIESIAADIKANDGIPLQIDSLDKRSVELALWREYKRRGGDDVGVTVSTVASEITALLDD